MSRPPLDGDLVPVHVVCQELRLLTPRGRPDVRRLTRMSRLGQFPELLVVTRKHQLVRASDYEAWKEGRWRGDAEAQPAEPAEAEAQP